MKHLDLFSGIGGFAYAADQVWDNVEHTFCEIDSFCQKILQKHWPQSKIYGDIRTLTTNAECRGCGEGREFGGMDEIQERKTYNSLSIAERNTSDGRPFILTGGFPCQPFSQAGRRKGTGDDRFLWPEMRRVISEFKPTWVIAENVRGILTIEQGMVFEQVCIDLENLGYEVQPIVIPAVAVNAPHRRDRVWFIANRPGKRSDDRFYNQQGRQVLRDKNWDASQDKSEWDGRKCGAWKVGADASDTERSGLEGQGAKLETRRARQDNSASEWNKNWVEVATRLCTVDDGLPNGLARPRGWRNAALKGAGNAIVPQVSIEIMKAIRSLEKEIRK